MLFHSNNVKIIINSNVIFVISDFNFEILASKLIIIQILKFEELETHTFIIILYLLKHLHYFYTTNHNR